MARIEKSIEISVRLIKFGETAGMKSEWDVEGTKNVYTIINTAFFG